MSAPQISPTADFLPEKPEERNENSSEISDVLSRIDQQKNEVVQSIGYLPSIDIWENMRNECSLALSQAKTPEEKSQLSHKIKELEGLEIEAFSQKISKTLQESGWQESETIYSTLLQKLQTSTLQGEIKQSFFAHLSQNLEISKENIREKEFLAEQETQEKNIRTKSSYKKSIPQWDDLLKKYESEQKTTSIPKYKEKFLEKISEIKGKKILAQSYSTLKETKDEAKGESWKKSKDIYVKVLSDASTNPHISDTEKNELKAEISEYLAIAKANITLKEEHGKLIDAEKKVQKLGYRKSKKYWKKLQMYYKFLGNDAKEAEGSKQRVEDFATKEKEMQQNTEIADLHGRLENSKDNDNWNTSQVQYSRVRIDADDAEIPKSEKQEILAKANTYLETAKANAQVKDTLTDAKSEISGAVEKLDWDESKSTHEEIEKSVKNSIENIDEELLDSSKKTDLRNITSEISDNIKTCTKEEKAEELEDKIFDPEKLSKEHPQFKHLYRIFLAVQFQRHDPKILEQKRAESSNENFIPDIERSRDGSTDTLGEQETSDIQISAENIQQQQIQETQKSPDKRKTHTIDISSSGIAGADVSQANTQLENAVQNSEEIITADSEQGLVLNSKSSQHKYFAKSMISCLPPEISQHFTSSQVETYLSQKSQDTILKTHLVD